MTPSARPVRADGEATRGRIVEAAGVLVAEHGFAQTPSKSIATRARVDLASINYHFGGRDGLYQWLLAEAHRGLIALPELTRLTQTNAPASERLGSLIAFLLSRTAQPRSWHGRVLAREILMPSPHLRGLLEEELRPKVTLLTGLLSEITGIPAHDPTLVRALLSVAAPCAVLLVAGPNVPAPFQAALAGTQAEVVGHFQTFALAGLEALGRQYIQGAPAAAAKARRGTPPRKRPPAPTA